MDESGTDDAGDRTLAAYEQGVEAYLAGTGRPHGAVARWLDRFAALLPGASVLEIGSGPGWDAEHLESRGLRVTRSDATLAFARRLRAAGHEVRLIDVRRDDLGGPWDGVVADAVLLHVERSGLPAVLRRLHEAVRPGGLLAMTLKEGDGEGWSTHKLGLPRHFTYWREQPLREALTAAGWDVVGLEHVQGSRDEWLEVLARR